jgi:hypothetical protein
MKEFGLKLCLFLFLVAVFSGRTNELGALTGAITGTILFWPLYRTVIRASALKPRLKVLAEEEPADMAAD